MTRCDTPSLLTTVVLSMRSPRDGGLTPDPTRWHTTTLPDLPTAERMLEWMGRVGYTERQLVVVGTTLVVRGR